MLSFEMLYVIIYIALHILRVISARICLIFVILYLKMSDYANLQNATLSIISRVKLHYTFIFRNIRFLY